MDLTLNGEILILALVFFPISFDPFVAKSVEIRGLFSLTESHAEMFTIDAHAMLC